MNTTLIKHDIYNNLGVMSVNMADLVILPGRPIVKYPKCMKNEDRPLLADHDMGGCTAAAFWEMTVSSGRLFKDEVSGHVLEKSDFVRYCRYALVGFMAPTYGSRGGPVFHAFVHELRAVLRGIFDVFRAHSVAAQ
jgi:hypothetical protein